MCDYSLGGLPSRLAVEGDELVVHRFPTYSKGLAPAAQAQIEHGGSRRWQSAWRRVKELFALPRFDSAVLAVCVPPGASLILKRIPGDLQRKWNVSEEETVVFTQTSAEVNTYRDAICFRNGRHVSLQQLREGLFVKVASLGGETDGAREPAAIDVRVA